MKKTGVGLLILCFIVLLHSAVGTVLHGRTHPHPEVTVGANMSEPWEAGLTGALAVAGMMLAAVPIRRGERWGWWTMLTLLVILVVTRVASDPRCRVVYDTSQHGCHTFAIAMILGAAGLALTRK
jgi:hypothetical protein